MFENIFVGFLCFIAFAASLWAWYIDNGIDASKNDTIDRETENTHEKN